MKILIHQITQTEWVFIKEFTPQFSTQAFVNLQNAQTSKIETFCADTYKYFFKPKTETK